MKYETYKSNLIGFLSENIPYLGVFQIVSMRNQFKKQLESEEDENIKEVIRVGIEFLEKMYMDDIDMIEVNRVRMNKRFQDWKIKNGVDINENL